ncbi:hypothetical protein [Lysinibacillus capsici]|uniref:hypothetical protein n=1 Tax=Lysinibacillus capsici TaxID=2115968 RepID=UPI003D00153D
MNVSEFTLTLIFLFLPGILGVLLIGALTTIKVTEVKIFSLYVYLLSVISYLITGFINDYKFVNFLLQGTLGVTPKEILIATITSLILSIIIIYIINFKLMYKLAASMRLSTKYGSNDVWLTLFNDKKTAWITLRPSNCGEYFVGEVEHFSDDNNFRELTLLNVAVYENESGRYLFSQEKIYFSFPANQELTVEIGSHFIDETRKENQND